LPPCFPPAVPGNHLQAAPGTPAATTAPMPAIPAIWKSISTAHGRLRQRPDCSWRLMLFHCLKRLWSTRVGCSRRLPGYSWRYLLFSFLTLANRVYVVVLPRVLLRNRIVRTRIGRIARPGIRYNHAHFAIRQEVNPERAHFFIPVDRHLPHELLAFAIAPVGDVPPHLYDHAWSPLGGQHCAAHRPPTASGASAAIPGHREILHAQVIGQVVDAGNPHRRAFLLRCLATACKRHQARQQPPQPRCRPWIAPADCVPTVHV